MGQVLYGSVKTTHAVRTLMQRSKPHRQAHRVFTAELGKRDLYGSRFPNGPSRMVDWKNLPPRGFGNDFPRTHR